ncbi:MAG: hypothetical protein ACYC8T_34630 [Myxococcaceae bacterium]
MDDRRHSAAALMHLDVTNRFAPSLESVRAVIAAARERVAQGVGLLEALTAADPANGLAAYYARKLLGRLSPEPFLVRWLNGPRSRREVISLLDKALRTFCRARAGGWRVSSGPKVSPASTASATG